MLVASEAAWDSRAVNGDGQCWFFVAVVSEHFRGRLITTPYSFNNVRPSGRHKTLAYFRGYMGQPRFQW